MAAASSAERRSWVSDTVVPRSTSTRRWRGGAFLVVPEPDGERIVDDGDRWIELVIAHSYERAPLVDRLAVEPGDGEELEDVRDRRGFEHHFVAARRQLDGVVPRACLGRGAPSERGTIQPAEGERGVAGDPIGAVVAGDARQTTLGGFAGHRVTGRVGERPRPVVGAAEARRLETAGPIDERPHHAGPLGRGRLRGSRVGCGRLTAGTRRGQARPPGIAGRDLDRVGRPLDERAEPGLVDHGGGP